MVAEALTQRRSFARIAPLGINLGSLYRPFVNIVRTALSPEQFDGSLRFIYGERARTLVRHFVLPRFTEERVPGEPYLFFPLHVPGDSAITVRAPEFSHQEHLVEYLAERALPLGMKLYVKPHPACRDAYPIPMLAGIRRLPNVRLVDPMINSHEMIANSRGVVVITSTVGFEAVYHAKPIIVCGRVFYRGRGVTHDVDELWRLPETIERALAAPPSREAILRFLHAAWKATVPGRWADTSLENIERVGPALIAKAERVRPSVQAPRAAEEAR
jgi:hypothetical protein